MSLPTLPTPACTTYFDVECVEVATRFYKAEQMQAYGQACREAALEEAALFCESAITSLWDYHGDGRKQIGTTVCTNLAADIRKTEVVIAAAIRSLK